MAEESEDRTPAPAPQTPRRRRLRRLTRAALAVLLVVAAYHAWSWWQTRAMEAKVAYWLENAEQNHAENATQEAVATLIWLLNRFPESRQVPRMLYDYGLIRMEYFGDMVSAQNYFWQQARYYPFSGYTMQSLARLNEIKRFSDLGQPWGDAPYRKLVHARRLVLAADYDTSVRVLEDVLTRYAGCAVTPEVLLELGDLYLRNLKRPSQARLAYDRLRREYPQSECVKRIPPASELAQPDLTPEELAAERRRAERS